MILPCPHKGCMKEEEHLLDQDDNTVYCLICGKAIPVPVQTKTTLKTLNQVKRKVHKGLSFKCQKCGKVERPVIEQDGSRSVAVCKFCNTEMTISPHFIEAIKSLGANQDDDEADE